MEKIVNLVLTLYSCVGGVTILLIVKVSSGYSVWKDVKQIKQFNIALYGKIEPKVKQGILPYEFSFETLQAWWKCHNFINYECFI